MPDFASAPTPASAKTRNEAAAEELAPVDLALGQLAARRLPKKMFVFAVSTHF